MQFVQYDLLFSIFGGRSNPFPAKGLRRQLEGTEAAAKWSGTALALSYFGRNHIRVGGIAMNRISNLFPCNRFPRPLSSRQMPPVKRTRPEVEAMLRDMAYVLQLTRSLKESIVLR